MYYVGYVAYFQLNIDYIVDTYCVNKEKPKLACNGKCHLAKQLQSATTDSINSEGITSLAESFFPVFYTAYNYDQQQVLSTDLDNLVNVAYNQSYSFDFDYVHFKPPIA